MAGQKAIVLVTVDCFRADHAGFMGYTRPTTPFLDSIARESFVVPSAIVAGAPTYYSVPGILASRYPLELGRDVLGLAPGEPTLASTLRDAGYATAAFCAANPYISTRFGYEQGFDVFRDYLELPVVSEMPGPFSVAQRGLGQLNRALRNVSSVLGMSGLYDELYFQYCQRVAMSKPVSLDALRRFPSSNVIVDDAQQWIESLGQKPFFLWLHLMDPHSPYYPPEKAIELMDAPPVAAFRAQYLNSYWNRSDLEPKDFARHRKDVVTLYDAGIRWVDEQLRRFVSYLQQRRVWNECILAVTADHGEEFLEHGGRYHPPSQLTEELIRVPLLIRVPGEMKREISGSPFSLLNLAPTLLEAAAVSKPSAFRGQSQWQELRSGAEVESVAISECVAGCTNPFRREHRMGSRILSVRERRYKLIVRFEERRGDLFDLLSDPLEKKPLPQSTERPVRRRLLEIALDHVRRTTRQRDEDARMRAQLRDIRLECGAPESRPIALAAQ